MASFNEMDKIVITALGASTEQLERLETIGVHTKQAIANISNAAALSAMAGIDSTAATNIMAWAAIDMGNDMESNIEENVPAYSAKTMDFSLEKLEFYIDLIDLAQEHNEINHAQAGLVSEMHAELIDNPSDANLIYNFARNFSIMLEPALNKIYGDESVSAAAHDLLGITEAFFKKAIELFNGFGRARIMYAYMLCMQKRFQETIDIVEMALTLPKGGQDWMTAAYWYLTAKAAIGDTYAEASNVYFDFKEYAVAGSREERYIENTLIHYFE